MSHNVTASHVTGRWEKQLRPWFPEKKLTLWKLLLKYCQKAKPDDTAVEQNKQELAYNKENQ